MVSYKLPGKGGLTSHCQPLQWVFPSFVFPLPPLWCHNDTFYSSSSNRGGALGGRGSGGIKWQSTELETKGKKLIVWRGESDVTVVVAVVVVKNTKKWCFWRGSEDKKIIQKQQRRFQIKMDDFFCKENAMSFFLAGFRLLHFCGQLYLSSCVPPKGISKLNVLGTSKQWLNSNLCL